jgi:DNA (cytosine-5)-methyltransferase 1
MDPASRPTALEFFAGGGLARLGLAGEFDTIWANDIDPQKATAWTQNFGPQGFVLADIGALDVGAVPTADLAWASFPCQDLSLAGGRAGLSGERSGTFFHFMSIIKALKSQKRAPKVLVIENVSGLLTSHKGADFGVILEGLADCGYRAGVLEIDARFFVPQSRQRVFIIAVADDIAIPDTLIQGGCVFESPAVQRASKDHPTLSWSLPTPPVLQQSLDDVIDHTDTSFWRQDRTEALLASLSPLHVKALAQIQASGRPKVATIYRRTRTKKGVKASFAELRLDGIAGCLRTPSGGSSRQFILFIEGDRIKVRGLNAREAMRLMGVPDSYTLPKSQLAGLKIAGDGVAVPVVAWLSRHLLRPLLVDFT